MKGCRFEWLPPSLITQIFFSFWFSGLGVPGAENTGLAIILLPIKYNMAKSVRFRQSSGAGFKSVLGGMQCPFCAERPLLLEPRNSGSLREILVYPNHTYFPKARTRTGVENLARFDIPNHTNLAKFFTPKGAS